MRKPLSEMTNEELWQLFPIRLEDHNPAWKQWYEQEEQQLVCLIGEQNIERISHIGSTAVEGLIAKPTIDILVEISQDSDTDAIIRSFEQNGYIYSRQPKNPSPHMMFLKGYTEQGFAERVFHIHVRYAGDWEELYFRDYLRTHPDTAAQYSELKARLKEKYEHNRDMYTEEKSDFVLRVSKLARKDLSGLYNPSSAEQKEAISVGIIGGADGPTAVFLAEKIGHKQRKWDEALEACKEKAVPVERLKTGDELKAYLIETFGAEETVPQRGRLKALKINALMNSHPEALLSPAMPDENAPKEQWLEWAKQSHMAYFEAAERLPDDTFGFRYAFLRLPRNEATQVYYHARKKECKENGLKGLRSILKRLFGEREKESEITLDIELSTCQMSIGNGCGRLVNDLVLWRGITKQDIDQCTPQFMAYAAAMRDMGRLIK